MKITLPPAERRAPILHEGWRQRMLMAGVESRLSALTGKELVVGWDEMDRRDQQEDVYGVRAGDNALDMMLDGVDLVEER